MMLLSDQTQRHSRSVTDIKEMINDPIGPRSSGKELETLNSACLSQLQTCPYACSKGVAVPSWFVRPGLQGLIELCWAPSEY